MENVKFEIVNKAKELGFDIVKIAKYQILADDKLVYQKWVDKGYNGNMKWMEFNLDERTDPNLLIPNAKSIIVLGKSYKNKFNHNPDDLYKIARYAWGKDYHKVIMNQLELLIEFIKQNAPNMSFYKTVDSGKSLEKAWAEKAGIGWRGKNSLIINPDFGSFIFLAVIITDLELPADNPIKNRCGDCQLCIDSCPTSCITENRNIDASNCISYWLTVEARKEKLKPSILKANNKEWIYGCDICQNVCPYNQKVLLSEDSNYFPINGRMTLQVEEIEMLTESEFALIFQDSPIKNAKFQGLKNAANLD